MSAWVHWLTTCWKFNSNLQKFFFLIFPSFSRLAPKIVGKFGKFPSVCLWVFSFLNFSSLSHLKNLLLRHLKINYFTDITERGRRSGEIDFSPHNHAHTEQCCRNHLFDRRAFVKEPNLFLACSLLICCICQCYRVFCVARIVTRALRSVFWLVCFMVESWEIFSLPSLLFNHSARRKNKIHFKVLLFKLKNAGK